MSIVAGETTILVCLTTRFATNRLPSTDMAWMSFPLWECVFTTSTPINVKGYTLTTGNDTGSFPDRNPKKWTLEVKATSGGNWTTIDSRDVSANSGDALPAANTAESKVYAVASDKQGSYQFFRFKVSEAGGTIMQLGELKLQGIFADLVSPAFNGVIIDDTDRSYDNGAIGDQRVRFIGTYKNTSFDAIDKSILLMGGENMLYTPAAGASIGALRAYFKIGDDGAANTRRITSFNINFGEGYYTTGIISTTNYTNSTNSDAWYTLDGHKLDGKPTAKGIYVNNGKKVVIK